MFGQTRAGRHQMLAVVEDQQHLRPAEFRAEAIQDRAPRGERETERGGGRRRHQGGIAEASRLHQPDTVVARAQPRRRGLESEAGLARPTGAGEREQAITVKQADNLTKLPVAPDKARQRDRQVMTSRLDPDYAQRMCLPGAAPDRVDRSSRHHAAAPIQALGPRVGLRLQVAPKRLAQPLRMRQRVPAATRRGEQRHQRRAGRLRAADRSPQPVRAPRRRPRPDPDEWKGRPAVPGALRSPPPADRPPTVRSDPQGVAHRRETGRPQPPPRTHRRRPPPSRPETAPACRPATGARPKPRRPPPPAPAGRQRGPRACVRPHLLRSLRQQRSWGCQRRNVRIAARPESGLKRWVPWR